MLIRIAVNPYDFLKKNVIITAPFYAGPELVHCGVFTYDGVCQEEGDCPSRHLLPSFSSQHDIVQEVIGTFYLNNTKIKIHKRPMH